MCKVCYGIGYVTCTTCSGRGEAPVFEFTRLTEWYFFKTMVSGEIIAEGSNTLAEIVPKAKAFGILFSKHRTIIKKEVKVIRISEKLYKVAYNSLMGSHIFCSRRVKRWLIKLLFQRYIRN